MRCRRGRRRAELRPLLATGASSASWPSDLRWLSPRRRAARSGRVASTRCSSMALRRSRRRRATWRDAGSGQCSTSAKAGVGSVERRACLETGQGGARAPGGVSVGACGTGPCGRGRGSPLFTSDCSRPRSRLDLRGLVGARCDGDSTRGGGGVLWRSAVACALSRQGAPAAMLLARRGPSLAWVDLTDVDVR